MAQGRNQPSVDEQFLGSRWSHSQPSWASPRARKHFSAPKRKNPENEVGITEFLESSDHFDADSRPLGLFRWSFDDNIVKEVWPSHMLSDTAKNNLTQPTQYTIRLVYEGVSDQEVLSRVSQLIDVPVQRLRFVTPIDFFASVERHCVCDDADRVVAALRKVWNGGNGGVAVPVLSKEGNIFVFPPQPMPTQALAAKDLPDLEYTVVVRGCNGSIRSVMSGIEALSKHGFINYSSLARSGFHLHRSYLQGHNLLSHQFHSFLQYYLLSLAEGSPTMYHELNELVECLSRLEECSTADWKHMESRISEAVRKEFLTIPLATGLYRTHFELAKQFVLRVNAMRNRSDMAQVIRESVSQEYLENCLQSVVDVHYNSLASLRMKMSGRVVVGDVVCTDKFQRMDEVECRADHVPQMGFSCDAQRSIVSTSLLHVISTEAEAQQFTLQDIVLPKIGRAPLVGEFPPIFPRHAVGSQTIEELSTRLGVSGVTQMRLCPLATYRRLVVVPRDVSFALWDDARELHFSSDDNVNANWNSFVDFEGVRRLRSPFSLLQKRDLVARPGIKQPRAREAFVQSSRQHGSLVCAIKMTLPRGSSCNTALRQVFRLGTIQPRTILSFFR